MENETTNNSKHQSKSATVDAFEQFAKELALQTDETRKSEFFKRYLETSARFCTYSFHNQLLIFSQFPAATRVAGFRAWNELDRKVLKGSKGIKILAPFKKKVAVATVNGGEEEQEEVRFFPVSVFDVSQTEGAPLPKMNIDVGSNSAQVLLAELISFCVARGIDVEFMALRSGLFGFSQKGKIAIATEQSVDSMFSTLVHELAHVLLHFTCTEGEGRQKNEVQAEGVAFVVCKYFNVPVLSFNYLALYDVDSELVFDNLRVIADTARLIVKNLDRSESSSLPLSDNPPLTF